MHYLKTHNAYGKHINNFLKKLFSLLPFLLNYKSVLPF